MSTPFLKRYFHILYQFILECDLPESVDRDTVHKFLSDIIDIGIGVVESDPDHKLDEIRWYSRVFLKK